MLTISAKNWPCATSVERCSSSPRCAAAAVLERERSRGVVEDLDAEPAVRRLARRRVDAHVRHVARDRRPCRRRAPASTLSSVVPVNEPGSVFSIRKSRGRRSISGCSSHWASPSRNMPLGRVVGRRGARRSPARRPRSRRPSPARCSRGSSSTGGSLIGSAPVEVLVLDVDHDQRALGHVLLLDRASAPYEVAGDEEHVRRGARRAGASGTGTTAARTASPRAP